MNIKAFKAALPKVEKLFSVSLFFENVKEDFKEYRERGFYQFLENDQLFIYEYNCKFWIWIDLTVRKINTLTPVRRHKTKMGWLDLLRTFRHLLSHYIRIVSLLWLCLHKIQLFKCNVFQHFFTYYIAINWKARIKFRWL